MTVRISSTQLLRLEQTLDAAARPFDFGDPSRWHEEVLRRTIALFEAKAGHLDIVGVGFPRDAIFSGYSDETSAAWQAHWQHADAVVAQSHVEETPLYTRRYRYKLLGTAWEEQYRRSAVFQEFYIPFELDVDAAGLHVVNDRVRIHLHVDFTGAWTSAADECAGQLMGLIRPVLSASVAAIARANAAPFTGASLLDAVDAAVAVIDDRGRWRHCSAALTQILAAQDTASAQTWRTRVTEVAQYQLRAWNASGTSADALQPAPALQSLGGARVTLVPYRDQDILATRVMLLRVHTAGHVNESRARLTPDEGATSSREVPLRCPPELAHIGFTERQWDVARLLALGHRNQEIASMLSTSVHTARRHVESVLAKCGVTSRSAVATMIWRALS